MPGRRAPLETGTICLLILGLLEHFRDPENPNSTGVIFEVRDMEKFQALMNSDEGKKAMAEDGLKLDTLRMLVEFTP